MHIASYCFLATGRSCLAHMIERYDPSHVVMPSMVPDGLIAPFEVAGVSLVNYRLNDDLSPNAESMWDAVNDSRATRPLVVVVDYLGYEMPTREATIIAHKHGGLCLEDCAHSLASLDETDTRCSDVTLYSMNKILPVPDGAMMYSKSPELNLEIKQLLDMPTLDTDALNAYTEHLACNRVMQVSKEVDAWFLVAETLSKEAYERYYQHISNNMDKRKPSSLARFTLEHVDIAETVKKRKANAALIIKHLRPEQLYNTGTPVMAIPIRCRNRDKSIQTLREHGIACSYFKDHWREPPAWALHEQMFWDTHLLLPVNEHLKTEECAEIGGWAWRMP